MFRWSSAQPLPLRLEELLERAGATRAEWSSRAAEDVLLFLPPHQLLACGRLPYGGLISSYQMIEACLDDHPPAAGRPTLVNGERLLNLTAAELGSWRGDAPLPRACPLPTPPPLEAAVAAALLRAEPTLEASYQRLDGQSERGGAPADLQYASRLQSSDGSALVQNWNQQLERHRAELDLELVQQQLLDLEQECERQFLACRAVNSKLSWLRMVNQQSQQQLRRATDLLKRLLALQSRLI